MAKGKAGQWRDEWRDVVIWSAALRAIGFKMVEIKNPLRLHVKADEAAVSVYLEDCGDD